jgi:DNA recombination protein RmuC
MLLPSLAIVFSGMALGALVAWLATGNRAKVEHHRAELLASELVERNQALNAMREHDSAQREQIARLETTTAQLNSQVVELRASFERSCSETEQWRRDANSARVESAELRTALEKERTGSEEKIAMLQQAREGLSNQFEVLANRIMEEKSRAFTDQNQTNLTNLLNPIRETFGEFQKKVESLKEDGVAGRAELKVQIESLRSLNERLSADAESLVTALRGSSKTQGDWGEFVLENLLQSAGLRRDFEYRVQKTLAREDGSNARLDVIIDLPDNRHLVIDSKLSLNSYGDYCAGESEDVRKQALKQHIASIRNHFRELATRNYQNLYSLRSLDFVLMFVPIEPAFMLAIASDSSIWQEAYEKNVLLVSPSSLLCVVRTVAQIWRQERQTRNVEAIAKRGRLLYDKFRGFVTDLELIGTKLGNAREAYDRAYDRLAKGDGNLVWQAEKLVRLGIRPTKALPRPLVEEAAGLDESSDGNMADDDNPADQMEFAVVAEESGKQK